MVRWMLAMFRLGLGASLVHAGLRALPSVERQRHAGHLVLELHRRYLPKPEPAESPEGEIVSVGPDFVKVMR